MFWSDLKLFVCSVDADGNTALHKAAWYGHVSACELLCRVQLYAPGGLHQQLTITRIEIQHQFQHFCKAADFTLLQFKCAHHLSVRTI